MVLFYRLPFDLKTPIGYLIAIVMLYYVLTFIYLFAAVVVSLEIGFYLLVMESIKDIKNSIGSINETAKLKRNQSQKIEEHLRDSIQFHTIVKGLSIKFGDLV